MPRRSSVPGSGLLSTAEAARFAGTSIDTIKHWKTLGLIRDLGDGGKGHYSLYDPEEVRTAPARRVNLRARGTCSKCSEPHWAKGLCQRHYNIDRRERGLKKPSVPSTPQMNAETTLRRGRHLQPMQNSPYRVLARTCPKCGDLLTTPFHLIRKESGPLPRCPRCWRQEQRAVVARWTNEALDHATRNGEIWTGPEMELVLRGDLTVRQIAAQLGRTLNGVRYIKRQLIEKKDPRYLKVAGVTPQMQRPPTTPKKETR